MLIIVEGLWGVGKTSLCEYLERDQGFIFFREPDHKQNPYLVENIDEWYYQAHLDNLQKALRASDKFIVVERSIASTYAYIKSRGEHSAILSKMPTLGNVDMCIFLTVPYVDYQSLIDTRPHSIFQDSVLKSERFLRSYQVCLKKYILQFFPKILLFPIVVTKGGKFISKEYICSLVMAIIKKLNKQGGRDAYRHIWH
ncbi:MAG: deoxynucleoside kinase [bacterium]|nr:deoxynucleoside kinase [bacterium]